VARKLVVEILGDPKSLEKSLGRSSRAVNTFGRDVKQSEKHLAGFGRGAIVGAGALGHLRAAAALASTSFLGGAGLVYGLKAAISEASDLHEQINKVDVVFGKSAKTVLRWSKDSAKAMGESRTQALAFAGTFGSLLRPMGLTEQQAARMSTKLTQLGADLASFFNKSPEEALQALQSGLVGQVRPLRQFGVLLSEDRVKAEAFASGIAKANVDTRKVAEAQQHVAIAAAKVAAARKKYGENTTQVAQAELTLHRAEDQLHKTLAGSHTQLTDQQKAMARYRIILHDTALAQGDFKRTSGGLANQQRILKAQIADTEAEVGKALMPTVLKLTKALTGWLGKSKNQKQIQKDVNDAVKTGTEIVKGATPVIKGMAHAAEAIAKALGGWKNASEFLLTGLLARKLFGVAKAIGAVDLASSVAATGGVKKLRLALATLYSSAVMGGLGRLLGVLEAIGASGAAVAAAVVMAGGDSGGPSKTSTSVGPKDAFNWLKSGKASQNKAFLTWLQAFLKTHPNADASMTPTQLWNSSPEFRKALTAWYRAKVAPTGMTAGQANNSVVGTALGASRSRGASSTSFHLAGERSPYDCSAFVQAVFAHNGIRIGSNTYSQIAGGRKVNLNDLQPGDLVFFNYDKERWPGHVAIYVGGGMCVHDHGASGGVAYQSYRSLASGSNHTPAARCYLKSHNHAGAHAGGGAPPPTPDPTTATNVPSGGLTVGKGGHAGKKQAPVIPVSLQMQLAQARLTTGSADDLKALERIQKYLTAKLAHTSGDVKRLPIVKALAAINREIRNIKVSDAKAKLKQIHDAFTETWGQLSDVTMRAFDRATQRGLDRMQKEFDGKMKAIDDRLAHTLKGIEGDRAQLTPSELALKQLQDQREQQAMADQLAQAQKAVADAIAGGNPDDIAQAQKDLANVLLDEREAQLQKQADVERAARDSEADQRAQAAQDQADAEKQTLQDQQDAQVQAYQDQRDVLREHLDAMLKLWLKYYLAKNELANKAKADILAFIAANPDLGITADDINSMFNDPAANSLTPPPGGSTNTSGPGRVGGGGGLVVKPLASGGIVRRPTLALVGEAGPEAVIPLGSDTLGGGGLTVNLNIGRNYGDAQQLAREITPHLRREFYRARKRNGTLEMS
jgi:cell wall-associated NlpC family hydrolase